jgi:Fe-S-cluster containining protein
MLSDAPVIKIINAHKIFTECALCLSQKTGWKIETDFKPSAGEIYVVFGAHEIAPSLLSYDAKYVIMNSEQSNSQFLKNKYYLELMKKNVVCEFSYKDTLTKYKIKPLAYFTFEFVKFELNMERIYDICFIGSANENRIKLLQDLQKAYPEKSFFIDTQWKHQDVKALTNVLSQSKYVLNIPYYTDNGLETHRINKALACGCKVVSYPSADPAMDDIYKKYIHFTENFIEFFGDESRIDIEPDYEGLLKEVNSKHLPHLIWAVGEVWKLIQ